MHSPKKNIQNNEQQKLRPCSSLAEFQEQYHAELKNITILSKKLAELLQNRGSFDPAVRGARISLRDSYERLLLSLDTSSSFASYIEQDLWRLHYTGIEEFRTKIRNLSPSPNNRRNANRENLLRVVNSFKGFLDEASGYFHGLIVKLRVKYGLPPSASPAEGLMCLRDQGLSHCAVSCLRLLIYLGDLARYKELFAVQNPRNRDWTVAANYYKQAAARCPSNGNPHNQKRQHVCKISTTVKGSGQLPYLIAAAEKEGLNFRGLSHLERHTENSEKMIEEESNSMAIKQLWECFEVHLMQIIGAILSKSCLEELEDAVSKSESVLQQLFIHHINELEVVFPSKKSYPVGGGIDRNIPILEVVVILIFIIHDTHKPTQNVVTTSGTSSLSILFIFCCLFVSLLVEQAKQSEDNALNLLLPGVIVFMEWVASQSSILKDIKIYSSVEKGLLDLKQNAELLKTMLLKLQVCPRKNTENAILDITSKSMRQTAIWEDYELLGFCPLSCAHQNLDFSNLCMTRAHEGSFYVKRFIGALSVFNHYMESEMVCLDNHKQDEEMECNPKGDAVSPNNMQNLKETNSIVDGNQLTSLKDWVQSSIKNLVPTDLPLVSDQGKILDADEDPSRVHLTMEEDCQHLEEDYSTSIEKSLNELHENPMRQARSALALKDSFAYASDHPQPVSSAKDGKQPQPYLDQTKDSLFENREGPLERPQKASLSTENTKELFALSHSDKKCGTPIQKGSFYHASDHPQIVIECTHCGKQIKISDVTQRCLQTRQEAVRRGQGNSSSDKYLRHPVSPCHKTNICEDDIKGTDDVSKLTAGNKLVDLRSFSSNKGSSSQLFSNVKTPRAENLRWLDDYTHIKPSGLIGTCTGLYHNFPILSSDKKRKKADTSIYNIIFNSQEMKQYKSRNPFIGRISD